MHLKSLEIHGFKTFPDKTVLKFEEDLVAVVGPNGSGKSNVSDAIRWVLGEQSARVLRCSKMEDVIFKGTTGRKSMGYAEVSLNIDNRDRRLAFDNDSVCVTRRYYRSGESEYLINKASVRLKDINELFMDTGMGRDGYSMIGQGKIDSIVGAKSEERREIFEEASGISRYRYRKEESERRLSKAEENLIRLRDILAELDDRVEPLKVQSEKAQKFIEYDGEKKGLEIGIWVETLKRSANILRGHEEKTLITQNRYQAVEAELEKISADIEKNFAETNNITLKIEEIRNFSAERDKELLSIEGEISLAENDILHASQNIQRLEGEISANNNFDKNIDDEIAEKLNAITEKNSEIQFKNAEYIDLSQRLEETRKGSDSVSREIESLNIEIARLNANVSEERVRYSSSSSSVDEIKNRAGSVDLSIAKNKEKALELEKEEEELKLLLNSAEENILDFANKIEGHELRLNSRKKKQAELKAELDKTSLDASEENRRANILSDLERNFEGFTGSVKLIMRESERKLISGIHGPVTKIISTKGQFSVAIETALGAAMQNIVVGTEQDAKNAINLLKKRDSGRATFLPLTTIKGKKIDVREIQNMDGFVGIASNLVTCEEKYEGIRDSLLGRTAVADNLDNAVAIAKKSGYRFRLVTLDGQQVNAGGSLTGGSLARNSGLLSRSSEIERIRKKAQELLVKAKELEVSYSKLGAEINEIDAVINLFRDQMQSASQEKIKILAEDNRVKRDRQINITELTALTKEKEDSQLRIDHLTELMLTVYDRINSAEKDIQLKKDKILTLSGTREQDISACDEISKGMQELRIATFSAEKDKESLETAVAALTTRKNDSKGLIDKLRNEIQESQTAVTDLQVNIDVLKEKTEILKAEKNQNKEKLDIASNERNNLEKQSVELRKQERDTSAERETIGYELARLTERKENLQKEYDTINQKLWDEYELTRREAEEQGIVIEDMQKSQRRLSELKNKIKALGAVNVAAVVEYKEVKERYDFLKEQITDVEKSRIELLKLIHELTEKMQEQFSVRFTQINKNFDEIFKELFGGGNAELTFTDDSDILNSGIEIKVHPPGKIVSHIESLSGGEKALVAISIYFAIMKVSPPPFCMLDEVEAALDDVNVRRFADYLHRMNDNTQFIVITHRRGTMEEADMLYGVTMQDDGISKLLALKNNEVEEKLGMKSS